VHLFRAEEWGSHHSQTTANQPLQTNQDAVLLEQPVQYNKEDLLSPCFVVFGKRKA